jgi:choline-sulfatase
MATVLVGTADFGSVAGAGDRGKGLGFWLSMSGLWAVPCIVMTLASAFIVSWLLADARVTTAHERQVGADDILTRVLAPLWTYTLVLLVLGAVGVGLLSSDSSVTIGGAVYGFATAATLSLGAFVLRLVDSRVHRAINKLPIFGRFVLVLLPVLLLLALVFLGETSGGGGPFGLWGVLRREELDLGLPLYAGLAFACGLGAALTSWRVPRALSAACVLALLGATMGARAMGTATALHIEQGGTPAVRLLGAYQALSDRDGDGFAANFGGGDCNDDDADIQPETVDIPGNGVDEDCSGIDAEAGTASAQHDGSQTTSASSAAGSSMAPGSAVSGPTPAVSNSALPKDANIVFITIDTLRHDLGYAGNPRPLSPNIDKLAAKALVYDNAYALASYTSKSLGPLMIGRYGSETNRGWMHFNKYPESDIMVQERLSKAGIFTLSVQGHWYFKADTGLGRGFDVLDMSAAPARPQGEGDKTVNSEQLSDAAIALLKQPERSAQRFFLWVHYLDPHAEYVTHADFNFGSNGRAKYDAEVAFTDHHVGRVVDAIESAEFSKRTLIVITSDHGEAFGEHGLIRHGFELWEELIHVPLVVYVPGAAPRHLKARRSAIDLVPTFLEVMGVPLPQGDDALSGESLSSEWGGGPSPERPVFVDMPAGPYNGDRQAYIDNDLKLVVSNSRPMGLYNLATDPGETQNLADKPLQVDAMLERLKAFRSKLRVVKVKPQ